MTDARFRELVISLICKYFEDHNDTTNDIKRMPRESVFIVWQCKALQNFKALASTTFPDGMYYEITYNGDKDEIYFDAYKKWENICFKDVSKADDE